MRRRKRKAFEKKPIPPHERAERVLEAASQPVSTEAPAQTPDVTMKAIDEETPEKSDFEQSVKDYYGQTDVEGQGGVPNLTQCGSWAKEPPDTDPMPLQHLEARPTRPPAHCLY